MDKALKMLIGLASVAVIAAAGYYFAGEWRDYWSNKAQGEQTASLDRCQTILRELDGWVDMGKPPEFDLDGTKARFRACLDEVKGTMFEATFSNRLNLTR